MMDKVLEEAFYGGGGIYRRLEQSDKYHELEEEFEDIYHGMFRTLGKDVENRFDDLIEVRSEMISEASFQAFVAGFRFCWKLTNELIDE